MKRSGAGISFRFFALLDRGQWRKLLYFWASSLLGSLYSLGIIPLVSFVHGYTYAAYLGIYFIFWSGGNILIVAVINNFFWPKICASKGSVEEERRVTGRSLLASIFVSIATAVGTSLCAYVFAPKAWGEYIEIDKFLAISSIALGVRVLNAWQGMIILNFNELIAEKTKAQLFIILLMFIFVFLVPFSEAWHLAWLLVFLEIGYFLGYLYFSLPLIRVKRVLKVQSFL